MSIRHGGKIVAGSINKDQIEEYIDSEIESKSFASINIINGLTSNNTNELPLDGIKLDYPNQILSVNIGNTIILPSLYTLSEDGLKVVLENEIESNIHYSISYIKRYEIGSMQPVGTHNVGDIFYTTRTDTNLNGAVECNGETYNVNDFIGNESVGNLLRDGKLPYVSMSEYSTIISSYGSCRAFGWDGSDSFRVPLLNDVYIEAGIAESVGEFISESLPNITGHIGGLNIAKIDGAFYNDGTANGATGNIISLNIAKFDASRSSSTYQDGAKVKPDSVRYRAMVQLATFVKEVSIESYNNQLIDKTNECLTNIENVANTKLSEFDNMFSSNILTLLETMYPIGSLYFGTQTTCPMMTIIPNSTWELVTSNKALWTGNGSNANTTIEAGLPNITGTFRYMQNLNNSFNATGVFNIDSIVNMNDANAGTTSAAQVSLDASRSNPIYGNSDTVQPPAYVINVWRRTK